ncbi:hypothetical protein L7F22_041654 [Adiantum nelumboides]|nr:hypothetical protein [Adiantum nelumboides]
MKSISSVISSASAALQSESQIAAGGFSLPSWMKWLGLALAVGSGFLIGASFVFKKRGLLAAQRKYQTQAGESYAYLKNPLWWTGMTMMILGEVLNLVAYAVSSAVLVTPLGALSVVICAILSSFFLNEKLTLFGKIGCFLCIVGSTVIALNGPEQHAAGEIKEFQKLFLSVGFLVWAVCIVASVVLAFFVAPKYGKKYMLVHITICSLIGGLSVSTISGIGSAVVLTIQGENQFKHWFLYFLLAFVVITLVTEIIFLNKALELFNTAMVTPTYYVLFTFATLVTSVILFQGLDSSAIQIITIVLGFLTICAGITLLQLSKIDPDDLTNKEGAVGIDRGTTMLLRASRSHISHKGDGGMATAIEDPGMDTVRGGLGVIGSMVRARSSRKIHASSDAYRQVEGMASSDSNSGLNTLGKKDLERYELHDRPVPRRGSSNPSVVGGPGGMSLTLPNMPSKRDTTISFVSGSEDPHGHHSGSEKPMEGLHNILTSPPSNHGILMSPSHSQIGLPGSRKGSLEPPASSSSHQHQQRHGYTTEPASFLTPIWEAMSPRLGLRRPRRCCWAPTMGVSQVREDRQA